MKIYALAAGEDWIVDRLVKEWDEGNPDIASRSPRNADIIWLFASWCWQHLLGSVDIRGKKIVTTIHHIVPEKFGERQERDFLARDSITTAYHVYNDRTKKFISSLTNKPIHVVPYWANQNLWRRTASKEALRKKYKLPESSCLIGSFQRDTEGSDLITPKLEKGPDLFADYLEGISRGGNQIHVVLAGWRRQYIISRLNKIGIPFTYFERPTDEVVNELYQTLDLYPVTSRCEGGPQSLIECGLLGIPVISRNVGISDQVLSSESINDDVSNATPGIPNVESMKIPHGFLPYRKLFESL